MGVCFHPRNFACYLEFLSCRCWQRLLPSMKDGSNSCCSIRNHASAVSVLDEAHYPCPNSETDSHFGENSFDFKNIELCSAVVTVLKSLNWKFVRRLYFPRAVEKHGFVPSFTAHKMLVNIYAFSAMEFEVFVLLKEFVCYYQKADLSLSSLLHSLLDSPGEIKDSSLLVSVFIKVFASNKMLENAFDTFVESSRLGLQPGIRSCNFFLKCLAEADHGELMVSLFEKMKSDGPFPNVYTYTILMNFFCSKKWRRGPVDIRKATEILASMEKMRISPSIVSYGTYVLGLCRVGKVESALDFIRKLKSNGKVLNSHCYNAIIHGFVSIGDLDKAVLVFSEMKDCGISPDSYSYSALIEGFCRSGNLEGCFSLLEEMESNGLKPSLVTYTSILKGICKTGSMSASLDLFRKIGSLGYRYDTRIYTVLITGFCLSNDADSASRLVEEMIVKNDLLPNSQCYNSLILASCKNGSLEKALMWFETMAKAGFLPSLLSFNQLIHGHCKEGRIEEALRLIEEMRGLGFRQNEFTYSGVISRLCNEYKPEKALELIPGMLKADVFPSLIVYSSLINGFFKKSNLRRALVLYSKMLKAGVRPDLVTFTILINVLCAGGKVREAYRMFREMDSENSDFPDEMSYTSMISGFCGIGDMKMGWILFREMGERNVSPTVATYTCMMDGFFKIGRIDMVELVMKQMDQKGLCPDSVTFRVAISGFRKLGFVDAAEKLLEDGRKRGIVDE